VSVQRAVQPERRVLFEHGPDLAFDFVVNLGVEEERLHQSPLAKLPTDEL
jgi:oxalate decarboxylase